MKRRKRRFANQVGHVDGEEPRHEEEAAKTASGGHGRRTEMFGSVGRAREADDIVLSASKEETVELAWGVACIVFRVQGK